MREVFSPHTIALISVVSVFLNGLVYLVLVTWAGIHYENRWAVLLAIASAGLAYLSAQFSLFEHPAYALTFVVMAIAAAALAGLMLIVG